MTSWPNIKASTGANVLAVKRLHSPAAEHDQKTSMIRIRDFEPVLAHSLPATFELLISSDLAIHPKVSRIVLHGSRGPAGGYHAGSDIDLSLIIDAVSPLEQADLDSLFLQILETTREQWKSAIELDMAVVFETRHCALKCFDQTHWNDQLCSIGGVDCFGLYKVGKGFHGFVRNAGIQVRRMYPCLKIWQST